MCCACTESADMMGGGRVASSRASTYLGITGHVFWSGGSSVYGSMYNLDIVIKVDLLGISSNGLKCQPRDCSS